MLHTAELERRDQNEIELSETIRNAGVLLEPLQGRRMKIEDCLLVALDFPGIRLAVKHPVPTAIPFCALDLKFSGGKREEVCRNRLRFGIAHTHPIARCFVKCL